MKKKIIAFLLVIVVILGIVIFFMTKEESNDNIKYKDVKVSTQTITNTITSSGEVTSDVVVKYLNTNKYFKTLNYEVGDYVKKGSKIVKYTNGTYLKASCNLVITGYNVPDSKEKVRNNNYIEYKCINKLKMSLSIDESDISKVKVGQSVTITLNYDESKTYDGKITSINQIGNYSSSGTKYTATVEFTNDGNVMLGMSGSVEVEVERSENVISVPIEAVQTNGNSKYVLVVDENNETSEAVISTGISNSAYVEVTSGLNGDETIRMISTESNETNNKMFDMKDKEFDFTNMERPNGNEKPDGGYRERNNR